MSRLITNFSKFFFAVALLWSTAAMAEPITLKLAFFSSDRTHLFRAGIKPFVDAVNAEGKGRVQIEVYLSGKLGQYPILQSQLLREGKADIAYVVQPYERVAFPDSDVIELPGLYKDGREGTLVFSHLAARGLLHGFKDFMVLGAFASEPESLHLRPPVARLADLKGKRIRANNDTEIAIFKKLGIKPEFVPLIKTAEAISSGEIDGAAVPPVPMIEFGIGRVATYHYMLGTSCVPLSLLMTRKRFDSLPADVQAIIRKYSGEWLSNAYIQVNESSTALVMSHLESEAQRKVLFPTPADLEIAHAVYHSIVQAFVARDPRHAALVTAARAELAKIRTGN